MAVLISLSLLKKLVKVVVSLVLILLIYGYYSYSIGAEPLGKTAEEVIDKVEKNIEKRID